MSGSPDASPSSITNPLEGLGWPLILVAAGSMLGMVLLSPEWNLVVTRGLAPVAILMGLLTLRHRIRSHDTVGLRRLILVMGIFELVYTAGALADYVPGFEPGRWFAAIRLLLLVAVIALQLGLARYCAGWQLTDLATAWRAAAAGACMPLLMGLVLAARMILGTERQFAGGSQEEFLFGMFCVVLVPGMLFLSAAVRTRSAGKRMRGGCVKCGFDLRGLRDPVCPECGTAFAEARRSLPPPSPRRTESPWVATSLTVMLIAAMAAATIWQIPGWGTVASKPKWLVMRDALRVVDPAARHGIDRTRGGSSDPWITDRPAQAVIQGCGATEAHKELLLRIAAGAFNARDGERLADRILVAQAEITRPLGRLGDVFAELAAAGLVRADQRDVFVPQLLAFSLRVRPRIRQGAIVPFAIDSAWRGPAESVSWGPGSGDVRVVRLEVTELIIGGEAQQPLPEPTTYSQGISPDAYAWFGRHGHEHPEQMPKLNAPLGDQEVRVRVRAFVPLGLRESSGGGGTLDGWPSEQEYHLVGRTSVVTAAESTVRNVDDPVSYRERTESLNASVFVHGDRGSVLVTGGNASVRSQSHRAAAFDMFLRVDGEDHPVGQTVIGWQFGAVSYPPVPSELLGRIRSAEQSVVKLVLVPSSDAAETTIDINEIVVGPPIELDARIEDRSPRPSRK